MENILKKPYEISVWEDFTPTDDKQFYQERKLLIIGSDTMTSKAKACNPIFKENINGTHTFTGSGYEYIIYPAVWNSPTSVKDPGGFNFAYIHLPNITIINNYGVSIEYKVLRSKNFLNTPTSMIIA